MKAPKLMKITFGSPHHQVRIRTRCACEGISYDDRNGVADRNDHAKGEADQTSPGVVPSRRAALPRGRR